MAREQFNHEWEDPKKKKPPYKGTPNPKPRNNYNEQHEAMGGRKPDPKHKNPDQENPRGKPKPHQKAEPHNPNIRQGDPNKTHPKGDPKSKGYPTDDLFKKMKDHRKSVKVEPLKKKTTESVLKEKMEAKEKLKKKSPASRARALLPKTKKKKKK
jgi:hypothetical protein